MERVAGLMGDFNLNVRMSVAANAAIFITIVLLLALAQPVQAYKVQVSELPDSIPLDKETTILITIGLEGAQSVRIDKVEIILSDPIQGIIAMGNLYANGTIIDDGGFIVSVSLISGTINQSWGYDSTTGIVYSVTILLKSSDFQVSKGNEFTVLVFRGLDFNPLRSSSLIFDITDVNPWPMLILGVGAAEAFLLLGVFYAFRKRKKRWKYRKVKK